LNNGDVELGIHTCPKFLLSNMARLFREESTIKSGCTVLTIAQKTTSDMSYWTAKVSEERNACSANVRCLLYFLNFFFKKQRMLVNTLL